MFENEKSGMGAIFPKGLTLREAVLKAVLKR
jgi:hypothetical protein